MVLGFASFVCTIGEEAALGGPILSGIGQSHCQRQTIGHVGKFLHSVDVHYSVFIAMLVLNLECKILNENFSSKHCIFL